MTEVSVTSGVVLDDGDRVLTVIEGEMEGKDGGYQRTVVFVSHGYRVSSSSPLPSIFLSLTTPPGPSH